MPRRAAVKEDSDQEMDEHSSDNEDTDTSSASDDDSSSGKRFYQILHLNLLPLKKENFSDKF